jgi:hypothetical protein
MDTNLALRPSATSFALSNSSLQFVQDGRNANAARKVYVMSAEDEFRELRQQMLILRNSNLTQYEREGSTVAHADMATLDNKYGFLCTMETLESELVELEDAQSPCLSIDAAVAKYRDMMDKIDENHRETTTADLFSAAASSKVAAAAEAEKKALASNLNGEVVVEQSSYSPKEGAAQAKNNLMRRKSYIMSRTNPDVDIQRMTSATHADAKMSRKSEHDVLSDSGPLSDAVAEGMDKSQSQTSSGWLQDDAEEGGGYWVDSGSMSFKDVNLSKMLNKRTIGHRERARELGISRHVAA